MNIILVEDDDVDARAVERAFKKARIANKIVRAGDGIEALELLRGENGRTVPARPQVLLVDLNMPRMNGIQFVSELRKDPKLNQSIVFILTTSNLDEDKASAYDLNVAGYILKARAGHDFLELIDILGGFWRVVEFPDGQGA